MNNYFQFLLGDIDINLFLNEYYGKKPILFKGSPDKFEEIFNLDNFNDILNYNQLNYPKIRVTNHNNTIHKYNLIEDKDRYLNNINNELEKQKILLAISNGGTLVFDKIHLHYKNLESFIDQISLETNLTVNVNGYFTAKNNLGVNVHFDRHDVFAIQIYGQKQWFYKEGNCILNQPMRKQQVPDSTSDDWNSVVLNQGDVFYCPRGLWHFTKTLQSENSLHLALGLYPLTLKDWLEKMEHQPEIAHLLEQYVQMPFDKTVHLSENKNFEKYILLIQEIAKQNLLSSPKFRDHIQLN